MHVIMPANPWVFCHACNIVELNTYQTNDYFALWFAYTSTYIIDESHK